MNSLFLSIWLIADWVNSVSLPGIVPGAKSSAFNEFALTILIPGIFLADFLRLQSFDTTNKIPVFFLYFLPLDLPFPALTVFFKHLFNSSVNPNDSKIDFISFVLFNDSNESSTMPPDIKLPDKIKIIEQKEEIIEEPQEEKSTEETTTETKDVAPEKTTTKTPEVTKEESEEKEESKETKKAKPKSEKKAKPKKATKKSTKKETKSEEWKLKT